MAGLGKWLSTVDVWDVYLHRNTCTGTFWVISDHWRSSTFLFLFQILVPLRTVAAVFSMMYSVLVQLCLTVSLTRALSRWLSPGSCYAVCCDVLHDPDSIRCTPACILSQTYLLCDLVDQINLIRMENPLVDFFVFGERKNRRRNLKHSPQAEREVKILWWRWCFRMSRPSFVLRRKNPVKASLH